MQAIRDYKISKRNLLQQCFYQLVSFVQTKARELGENGEKSLIEEHLRLPDGDILMLVDALRNLDCRDEEEQEIKRMLHILTSFATILVPGNGFSLRALELSHDGLLRLINDVVKTDWRNINLQAVAILMLACFFEELRSWSVEMQENEPIARKWLSMIDSVMKEEDVEKWVEEAISKDALMFLKDFVINRVNQILISSRLDEQDRDFYEGCAIPTLDIFVSNFIVKMSKPIRKLKFLDEEKHTRDTKRGFQRISESFSQPSYGIVPKFTSPSLPALRDFDVLMTLVADLYRNRPDLAIKYWYREGKLYLFVRWCSDCKPIATLCSFTKMLGSLACGPECSQHAFNFLNAPSVLQVNPSLSWSAFFEALQNYYQALSGTDGYMFPNPESNPSFSKWKEIHPDEVVLLQNFLEILYQILSYNESSRMLLFESVHWNALNRLFGLLSCNVPISLKAHLFDCLSAFAISPDISMYIWQLMEAAEVIGKIDSKTGKLSGGIKYELEEIESRDESYMEARSFLSLLFKIVSTTCEATGLKPWAASDTFMHYIQFVVDGIILSANSRGYTDPTEKWKLLDISLQIMSKLMNFPNFPTEASVLSNVKGGSGHPGYKLMLLMLSNDSLVEELLGILVHGPSAIAENRFHTNHFSNCIFQVFRILEYTLLNQESVLKRVISRETVALYRPLEQVFLANHDVLIMAPSFILCYERDDIAFWSIKFMYHLMRSSYLQSYVSREGNLLVRVLKAQKHMEHIKCAYAERLVIENPSAELLCPETERDLKYVLKLSNPIVNSESIRTAIVEFLNEGLDLPSPNFAEALLGFEFDSDFPSLTIADPFSLNSQQNCFYALMDVMRAWIPLTSNEKIYTRFRSGAMELVYRLCAHQNLSAGVLRYLRTREDFFKSYLEHIQYENGLQSLSISSSICQIYELSWFLRAFAIDLHLAIMMNQRTYVSKVLATLFNISETAPDAIVSGEISRDPIMKILENFVFVRISDTEKSNLTLKSSEYLSQEFDRAQSHLFESWRSLFGIIVTKCYENFSLDWRISISVNNLCIIMNFLKNGGSDQKQNEKLSEIITLLILQLRTQIESGHQLHRENVAMRLGFETELISPLFASILNSILSKGSTVGFRANLHASLFNFLQIIYAWEDVMPSEERSKLPAIEVEQVKAAHSANIAYLELNGHRLVGSMIMDLFEGPDVWKTVIFASMDSLISYSLKMHSNGLLNILIKKNAIRQLVQALKKEDLVLQSIIGYTPTSMNPLYIYEAKMTFLMHVAADKEGATHLQECGIIEIFSEFRALDLIPERSTSTTQDNEILVPSSLNRYYSVLIPVLDVSVQLIVIQHGRNRETASKLLNFIRSHAEALVNILKSSSRELNPGDISVLKSLTLILSEISNHDGMFEEILQVYASQFILLASNLLCRIFKDGIHSSGSLEEVFVNDKFRQNGIGESISDTFRNLISFVRSVASSKKEDVLYFLFRPEQARLEDLERVSHLISHRSPPVAMLFIYLRDLLKYCRQFISLKNSLVIKRNRIDELDIDEVSEFVKQSFPDPSVLDIFERRRVCLTELFKMITYYSRLIDTFLTSLENILVILWYYASSPAVKGTYVTGATSMMDDSSSFTPLSQLFISTSWTPVIPILDDLSRLELSDETAGLNAKFRLGFIHHFIRRLRDVILHP